MDERNRFGLYQSYVNRGSVGRGSVFGLQWCEWVGGLNQGLEGWGGLRYVCMIGESRCRWHVQVYVYSDWRTPAHNRCTQC